MQPFFLPVGDGERFCVFYPAAGAESKGAVLYIHPFAEEMNKSRRMVALQTRAFATAGYDVLQIDLLGCGDSGGDFCDASWQAWKEDVLAGHRCLRERSSAPLILWGLRAGCLLVVEAAAELPESAVFMFWQPVVSGRQHWQQFMRLKMAGEIGSGQGKAIGEQLREQLTAGQAVEIAGYGVAPALAGGLEKAELLPAVSGNSVVWLETSLRDEATLSPASLKCIAQWQEEGFTVESSVVRGPAFWQTIEVEDAPNLIAATMDSLVGKS